MKVELASHFTEHGEGSKCECEWNLSLTHTHGTGYRQHNKHTTGITHSARARTHTPPTQLCPRFTPEKLEGAALLLTHPLLLLPLLSRTFNPSSSAGSFLWVPLCWSFTS